MSTSYHGMRVPYTEAGLVQMSRDNGAVTYRDSRHGDTAEFN